MSNRMITFQYHVVFKPDCKLSQYITVLSQVHSNLTLTFSYMSWSAKFPEKASEIHHDSYIYFLGIMLSHVREAVKVINDWHNDVDIQRFVKDNALDDLLKKILKDNETFKNSAVFTFLKPTRDSVFHYTSLNNRTCLREVIEGITKKDDGHKFYLIEDTKFGSIFCEFSKEIISGIITKRISTEEEFSSALNEVTPLIVDVVNFCSTSIGFFLQSKGVMISQLSTE